MSDSVFSNVVLYARVDDPTRGASVVFSTIVKTAHLIGEHPSAVAEVALEIGPPVSEWDEM